MKSMHRLGFLGLIILLASCAPQFYYHFPKEDELRGYNADSLHWKYEINTVTEIPVADDHGSLYWLQVDAKTKLIIQTVLGEDYTFYIRSLKITGDELGVFGPSASWTGFDVRQHVNRTIAAREIGTMSVASSTPATKKITK